VSNDLSPSGSRWEPFSSPRPVLTHPGQREGAAPDHTEGRAAHPVYDITSDPTSTAVHPVAAPRPGRPGVRRTVVLVAAAVGLVLAGGAGGYAIGHATAGTGAPGIDGGAGGAGAPGGAGGFGGERHRLGGQGFGDGSTQGGGFGTPDGGTSSGTGSTGSGTSSGTGSGTSGTSGTGSVTGGTTGQST
jgi:hypothetical protein